MPKSLQNVENIPVIFRPLYYFLIQLEFSYLSSSTSCTIAATTGEKTQIIFPQTRTQYRIHGLVGYVFCINFYFPIGFICCCL